MCKRHLIDAYTSNTSIAQPPCLRPPSPLRRIQLDRPYDTPPSLPFLHPALLPGTSPPSTCCIAHCAVSPLLSPYSHRPNLATLPPDQIPQALADFDSPAAYDTVVRFITSHWVYTQPFFNDPTIAVWTGYNSRFSDTTGSKYFTANGLPAGAATGLYVPPATPSGLSGVDATCYGLALNPKSQSRSFGLQDCGSARRPLCRAVDRALARPLFQSGAYGRFGLEVYGGGMGSNQIHTNLPPPRSITS